jgi:hypothetical protein
MAEGGGLLTDQHLPQLPFGYVLNQGNPNRPGVVAAFGALLLADPLGYISCFSRKRKMVGDRLHGDRIVLTREIEDSLTRGEPAALDHAGIDFDASDVQVSVAETAKDNPKPFPVLGVARSVRPERAASAMKNNRGLVPNQFDIEAGIHDAAIVVLDRGKQDD